MPRILTLIWMCLKQVEAVLTYPTSLPKKLKVEVRVYDASKKDLLDKPASLLYVSAEETSDGA